MFTEKVLAVLGEKTQGNADWETTLGELGNAFTGGRMVQPGQGGSYVITPQGFKELVQDRLGFPAPAMLALDDAPELQIEVMRHLTEKNGDRKVLVRTQGTQITGVLGRDYLLLKNNAVLLTLEQMVLRGELPEDAQVAKFHLSQNGREMWLRLVAESWSFFLGDGKKDPAYGGLSISNDEQGKRSFQARALLARVSCFNYTLAEAAIKTEHHFAGLGDFTAALIGAAGGVGDFAGRMRDQLHDLKGHPFINPLAVFEKAMKDFGLPAYVKDRAKEYWAKQTEQATAFDIVQAITYGTQAFAEGIGRRPANWLKMEAVEALALPLANQIIDLGEDQYVMTVGDVISRLSDYDPAMMADGVNEIVELDNVVKIR